VIHVKRFIVATLANTCTFLDWLRIDHITHRHYLADWSDALDQRWQTGVWK
jgi:hypothetical protein